MAKIRDLPADQLPNLLKWTFATIQERDAQSVSATDVGRFAYVSDTQSFHILIAISPTVQWVAWYADPALQTPIVTSVTVTPSTVSVPGANSQQFTAAVAGTNLPNQNVTWTALAGTIDANGIWTAPAATGVEQTATITATSVIDATKSGTATATVPVAATPPAIGLTPSSLSFSGTAGAASPASQTIAIANTGGGALAQATLSAINYGSGSGWLAISVSGTTVTATATTGALTAATYTASFTVISSRASNTPVTVNVSFVVAAAASQMLVDIGTNLTWCYDWDTQHLPADLVWSARPWAVGDGNGSTVANWVGTYAGTSLDSKGWPVVPINQTFGAIFEKDPWPGTYKLSFKNKSGTTGDTVTSYSGNITLTNRSHNAGTNVTTYDVNVPSFASGQYIWLRWAGSTAGIEDVSLMRPLKSGVGNHTVGTALSDHIIDRLANFSTIRTMQTGGGSGSGLTAGTDTVWSTRTKPYSVQTRSGEAGRVGGVAIENLVAMANQAQKDLWINIPFRATDDYILQMARAICFGTDGTTPYTTTQGSPVFAPLDAGLKLYVEHGNEIWNSGYGYPANENYSTSQAEINAGDPNCYTYTTSSSGSWGYSWRRTGFLAVRASLIFRSVFGDGAMMTRVRPILATQHGRYATTSEPLNYIRDVWGPTSTYTVVGWTNPKQSVPYYLYALATAPYAPDDNSGLTVTTAATIISSTLTNLAQTAAGKIQPAMTWNHDTAATHGIAYVAYEGGGNLIPSLMPGGATTTTIQNAKDASYDATLGADFGAAITGGVPDDVQTGKVYGTLFKEWKARGGGLFMHYSLSQAYGSGSMFGLCPPSTDSGSDPRLDTGPKYDAIKAFSVTGHA